MTFPDFLASFVPQLLAAVVGALIGLYAVRLAVRAIRGSGLVP